MGGYVAMAVLRAAPSRVAGLALVNTRASADTPEVRRDRLAVAARVESDGVGWVPDEMGRVWLGRTTLAERPAVVARLRELIIAQRPEALAWGVRAMAARPPSFDVLRAAEVPALVVAGAEDALIPGEEATAMADALRGASLVEVDGAGHLLPLEAPTRLAEVLTGWLGSTRLA